MSNKEFTIMKLTKRNTLVDGKNVLSDKEELSMDTSNDEEEQSFVSANEENMLRFSNSDRENPSIETSNNEEDQAFVSDNEQDVIEPSKSELKYIKKTEKKKKREAKRRERAFRRAPKLIKKELINLHSERKEIEQQINKIEELLRTHGAPKEGIKSLSFIYHSVDRALQDIRNWNAKLKDLADGHDEIIDKIGRLESNEKQIKSKLAQLCSSDNSCKSEKSSKNDMQEELDSAQTQIDELTKEKAHLEQILSVTMGCELEESRERLMKEIKKFRYSVNVVSSIQSVCDTIDEYREYETLKERVNMILHILADYKKDGGK